MSIDHPRSSTSTLSSPMSRKHPGTFFSTKASMLSTGLIFRARFCPTVDDVLSERSLPMLQRVGRDWARERSILDLLIAESLTEREVMDRTLLSRHRVATAISNLASRGLISTSTRHSNSRGRPSIEWSLAEPPDEATQ